MENVDIASLDQIRSDLECLDLDVTSCDGNWVGFEAADVVATRQGRHESETAALRNAILDLRADDTSFASAFGSRRVVVLLSFPFTENHQIGKQERRAIQSEIEAFIRAGEHATGKSGQGFSSAYPTLHDRGATWHSSPFPVPGFDVGHATASAVGDPAVAEILRVLDDHRTAAARYRSLPLWLGLLMTDRWEFFRQTVDAVATAPPSIALFQRCYLADDSGRMLELRDGFCPYVCGDLCLRTIF